MEETLIPDITIPRNSLSVDGKNYSFYCKRPTRESAESIRKDLAASGYDALVQLTIINKQNCFAVWWRKK